MDKIWIIATLLFLIITFVFWRLSNRYYKKEYGKKMWKLWVTKTFYWQGVILISGGITIATLFALKFGNVLTF
ncbi:hypothetical protein [Lacinutrix sp.]|uniref:hypothetical protein n=1 Tax=Lacinutrix sp. TaxID=1937692 RepID=UPI0025BA4D0F|nr:hypothetical protein [Lacinutrix sp.]